MALERGFYGNIVTTRGDDPLLQPAKLVISDLGTFYFEDRLHIIEGVNWRASDVDYDYETLTRKKLRKVNKYKAFWNVKLKFMGRDTYLELAELESLMEQVNHTFTDTGVITPRRFFFYPCGDDTRPVIEVVKVSTPDITVTHINGKYIGYNGHNLVFESVEEFNIKVLPITEPIPVLPSDGMISSDGLLVGLEL